MAAFELAAAVRVIEIANSAVGSRHYDIHVVGPSRPVTASTDAGPAFSVVPDRPLSWAARADTVLVSGHDSVVETVPNDVHDVLRAAQARGARVASDVAVLNLALHLVEEDHGAAVAAATARHLVAPAPRDGGPAPHLQTGTAHADNPLQVTLSWAEEHLHEDVVVADLARHANMTRRSFSRHFRSVVGTTPLDWLHRIRIRRARELLEDTSWPVARIARECGFRSEATFRHNFARVAGMPPGRYRQLFTTTTSAVLQAGDPIPVPSRPTATEWRPRHGCSDQV